MSRVALYGSTDGLRGRASGSYEAESYTYEGRTGLTLAAKSCFDPGFGNQPVAAVLHGFAENIDAITDQTMQHYAAAGCLALAVAMRGRNGSDGSPDASGLEIGDIIDAVIDARTRYATASQVAAFPAGYSGGGGNAHACWAKAPDFWTGYTAHFGMSDYGADPTMGWYQTNGYDAAIEAMVGATPDEDLAAYQAREHAKAIPHALAMSGTRRRVTMLHDQSDSAVAVIHSDRVRDLVANAGLSSRLRYLRSTDGSYAHGYPDVVPGLITAEPLWMPQAVRLEPWKVPAAGRLYVCGWVQTKRFSVFLGNSSDDVNDDEVKGLRHALLVDYVESSGSLTLTVARQSGSCWMRVLWGSKDQTFQVNANGSYQVDA